MSVELFKTVENFSITDEVVARVSGHLSNDFWTLYNKISISEQEKAVKEFLGKIFAVSNGNPNWKTFSLDQISKTAFIPDNIKNLFLIALIKAGILIPDES